MNVSLLTHNNTNEKWINMDGVYVLTQPVRAMLFGHNVIDVRLMPGFKCDGLSVPKAFQWFLPAWDKKNPSYNLAGIIHDALYTIGWHDCREDCDDVFRGILRDSGISRFKAGVADKCLEWFAGGNDHWKNDTYKNIGYISVK